jgi:hypothetical protein
VELAESACLFAQEEKGRRFSSAVLPVVVLPDESLWTVCYSDEGSIQEGPKMADECEYFVDRKLTVRGQNFVLTHIHFVTLRGFSGLLSRFVQDQRIWDRLFHGASSDI